jgi:small-conductance mechanosensitive channel
VIFRCFARLIVAMAFVWAFHAARAEPLAQTYNPPQAQDHAALAQGRETLNRLQNQLATATHDSRLAAMQSQAASVEAQAQGLLRTQTQRDTAIKAELKKILPQGRSGRPARAATAAEKAAAAPLLSEMASVDATAREAQGIAGSARNIYGGIAQKRRESFSSRFFTRSQSPLFPAFWTGFAGSIGPDIDRLGDFARRETQTALNADQPKGVIGLVAGLIAAFGLAFPLRRYLEHFGRRKSGESVHPGFARTAAALWIVVVGAGAPTLAALALRLGLQWGGMRSDDTDVMGAAAVLAVAWASATIALGRVLATDRDPSQHLLPVSADMGRRVCGPVLALALVTAGGLLLNRLNFVIGASVSATMATDCLIALAYVLVAGFLLFVVRRGGEAEGESADQSPAWSLVSLALVAEIGITVAALLAGYTTLAALTSGQIFWLSLVAASTYLLLRFVDDLFAASFEPRGWAAHMLHALFNLRRTTIEQIGVLLAAGLELMLLIGALRLALTPFGEGGAGLFTLGRFGETVRIGSVSLSPGAIMAGLVTLAVGLLIVRAARTWVVRRYLPVTEWDAGIRNSVTTGVGYLGAGVALVCALAAMGLGFQQIALVASALSVGIGFGLQQIVQNFVSGIIVLIERPVKVGDWISVQGVDGDVRRIRVRATEIQTFDKSTVIVPNSDLITKMVTNRTPGERSARIELQLAIASPDDAERTAALILDIARAQPKALKAPEPLVMIDSLAAGGAVNFQAYVYVESARDVKRVKSDLYFEILRAFKREGVAFMGASGPTNIVVEPGPQMRDLIKADGADRGEAAHSTG